MCIKKIIQQHAILYRISLFRQINALMSHTIHKFKKNIQKKTESYP